MREKTTRRWLSLLLTVVMVLSLVPATALAAYFGAPVQRDLGLERADAIGEIKETLAGAAETTATGDGFMRIVHLDCGRKYFTVDWVKSLIDEMAKDGYSHLELAFGNDGLRFLLDNMAVTVGDKTYSSEQVTAGIQAGNKAYYDAGNSNEWTQTEMDEIIAYANGKDIGIIPLLNTPGHMDAIIDAMEYVGISNAAFAASGYGTSSRTVNLENEDAVAFTQALVGKYIDYFKSQGSEYFHLGTDEYANDILINYSGMGFGYLQGQGKYGLFVNYVNTLAEAVTKAGMIPMAFNDGIYYNSDTNSGDFNKSILVTYWSDGWGNYKPASAQFLDEKDFQLINTHGDFYYVLGKADSFDNYGSSYAANWDNAKFPGTTFTEEKAGAMFCIWCDYPSAETEDQITTKVIDTGILSTLAEKMGATATPEPVVETIPNAPATLTVGETAILSVDEPATWRSSDDSVISLSEATSTQAVSGTSRVTATAVGAGEATITATTTSATYTADIQVVNDGDPTVYRTINVTVGRTATDTIEGDWRGPYTTDDTNIATVSTAVTTQSAGKEVKEVTAIESGKQYLIVNTRANKLLTNETTYYNYNACLKLDRALRAESAQLWTITSSGSSYTVQDASNDYLTIGNGTASLSSNSVTLALNYTNNSGTWTISRTAYGNTTYYLNDYGGQGAQAAGWNDNTAATDSGSQWKIYEVVDTPAGEVTTVTFNGVAEGITYVTVGNVRYTINVIIEDLSAVTPLTVEYWITNSQVTANGGTSGTIAATAAGVYSESGALFSNLVPAEGTHDKNTVVFWKGTRLDSYHHQTTTGGVDRTKAGTDFTYIRYWDGSWAYSADGVEWTNVASGDQIVAYYLQKTEVTDEVTTQVVDWGPQRSSWSELSYLGTKYVLVDYAVKYESGEEYPSSFPTSNSLAFHCDTSTTKNGYYYRSLGMTLAVETGDYEVYMITVTPTSDNRGTTLANTAAGNTSYSYNGTEVVAWAATQEDLDNSGLGTYTSISGAFTYSIGGDPIVSGLEIYRQQGMKVTYYVRAKVTEDSLTVHYIDQTANQEFYSYNIAVGSGTTFNANIGLADPWKGDLANGAVTNSLGKEQTVSADLSTMPAIGAQYRYSAYTCVEVERSEDGKDVYLYYTFNNAKSFVIDFGLPLTITTTDLGLNLAGIDGATISGAKYGTVKTVSGSMTYTPNQVLENVETLLLTLTDNGDTTTYSIYIYPASNVLYEDNFLTQESGDRTSWTSSEATDNSTQTNGAVGTDLYVYGYDPAYQNSTGDSMGSAWKVTGLNASNNLSTNALTTSFYGNGFDLIAECGADTAQVYVVIKDKDTGKAVKGAIVDTRYNDGTLYQVPIAHLTLGDEANYTATIRAYYIKGTAASGTSASLFSTRSMYSQTDTSSLDAVMADVMADGLDLEDVELMYFDSASPLASLGGVSAVSTFALDTNAADTSDTTVTRQAGTRAAIDGFRVYRSSSNTAYKSDEQNVTYVNVLDAVKDNFAAYVEGDEKGENWTKANYESSGGPQNEIYLPKNAAVTFQSNLNQGTEVQISARAVTTTSAALNGANNAISSNTEMYYTVTVGENGVITVTNNGNGMLALGNLKVKAGTNFSDVTDATLEIATLMLRTYAAAAPVEPEEPEEPVFQPAKLDLNVTSANFFTRKIVTLSITASSDVAYLTVNGKRVEPTNALLVKWGLAKNYLYVVTDTVSRNATAEFAVVAYDANGVASEVYVKQG